MGALQSVQRIGSPLSLYILLYNNRCTIHSTSTVVELAVVLPRVVDSLVTGKLVRCHFHFCRTHRAGGGVETRECSFQENNLTQVAIRASEYRREVRARVVAAREATTA